MRKTLAILGTLSILGSLTAAAKPSLLIPSCSIAFESDVAVDQILIEGPTISPIAATPIVNTGSTCTIVVKVASRSARILEGYRLEVRANGKLVGGQTQGTLRPFEHKIHRIAYTADTPGTIVIEAVIDPRLDSLGAKEENPENNHSFAQLLVDDHLGATGPLPDLVFGDFGTDDNVGYDKTNLSVRILNRGGSGVSGPVELVVEVGRQSFRAKSATGLPAGATQLVHVGIPKALWSKSPHGKVIIDPSRSITESNRTNNVFEF